MNFCPNCQTRYAEDDRQPPCDRLDRCPIISKPDDPRMPSELSPENRLAWELYSEISELSGIDNFGLPKIDQIGFIFEHSNLELTRDEYEILMTKIRIIHGRMREATAARIAAQRGK